MNLIELPLWNFSLAPHYHLPLSPSPPTGIFDHGESKYSGYLGVEVTLFPQKPEIASIGRTSVSLYRKVDENMLDPEEALAFQHIRTALAGADLDQRARILTLADRLNLMLMAEASLSDWERKLSKNWANFRYLTILSWHDERGARINPMTVAGNSSVLLPVQDGNMAD
jgi:hypothetical protein